MDERRSAPATADPLVRSIVAGDGSDDLLPLVTTEGKPVVQYASERIAAMIVAGWPQAKIADARLLGEGLVRLAISHAAQPPHATGVAASSVTKLLEPYLERMLATDR